MGLIRLFLAIVVAIDHFMAQYSLPIDYWLVYAKLGSNAGYAVMYFYMISGFLVSYTLAKNYKSDLIGTAKYYQSRTVRIFSLYWPLLLLAVIAYGWPTGGGLWTIFLLGSDWRAAFAAYPAQDFSIFPYPLVPAWTLGAELTFYLFAPFVVRSLRLSLIVLCASAAVRFYFVRRYGFDAIWTYHFFPSTAMFFMLGVVSRIASERYKLPTWGAAAFLAVSAAVSISAVSTQTQAWDNLSFHISVACFAVSLPGIFEATKDTKWLNRLGDWSYPVYLTHTAVYTMIGRPLPLAAMVAIWILAAAFTSIAIEKPTARLMRRAISAVRPWRRRLASAP